MELRHLRYLVAVADQQHLGRAAERLHVSKSPLSRQLHELEDELGTPLLERVGRGIRTTAAGAAFADQARAILAELDRAVASLQALTRGEVGHLAIGFAESSAFVALIPVVVGAFRRRHPGVTLELQPLPNHELRLALQARQISAAFSFGLVEPDRLFTSQELFAERVALALPRAHPLARRKRLFLRDLRDQPFVWSARPERAPFLDTLWALLRAQGLSPRIVIETRSTTTRLSLVASGVGVTFVAGGAGRPAQVVVKPLSDLKLEAKGYLSWRPEDQGSPLLRSLQEITREAVSRR
jgi:DNA-binding transcriptional LysR family regulator